MSINKLAEYILANPYRRKRILEDQKYVKAFMAARYDDACETIVSYLTVKNLDDNYLLKRIELIGNSVVKTTFEEQKKISCIEALETFYEYSGMFESIIDFSRSSGLFNTKTENIKDVEVSIRPEVLLQYTKNDIEYIGAIKLVFSKTHPIDNEGTYISAMIKHFLESNKKRGQRISDKHCMVLDVFTGNIFYPPRAIVRKSAEIEAACEEIAARWNTL